MITRDVSNEELLLQLKAGDQSVFDEVVARFKNQLMNLVLRYLGNREDAEDVVQEAMVRVYINIHRYDASYKATTWIYTITLNLARSVWQKKHRWVVLGSSLMREDDQSDFFDQIADVSLSPDYISDAATQSDIIERALASINPVFREAVILRDMEGCTYEEIAAIMNLNLGTVKSKINRGRVMLKHFIRQEMDRR